MVNRGRRDDHSNAFVIQGNKDADFVDTLKRAEYRDAILHGLVARDADLILKKLLKADLMTERAVDSIFWCLTIGEESEAECTILLILGIREVLQLFWKCWKEVFFY